MGPEIIEPMAWMYRKKDSAGLDYSGVWTLGVAFTSRLRLYESVQRANLSYTLSVSLIADEFADPSGGAMLCIKELYEQGFWNEAAILGTTWFMYGNRVHVEVDEWGLLV